MPMIRALPLSVGTIAALMLTASQTGLLAAPNTFFPPAIAELFSPFSGSATDRNEARADRAAIEGPIPIPRAKPDGPMLPLRTETAPENAPQHESAPPPSAEKQAGTGDRQAALLGGDIPAPGSTILMADVLVGEKLKALVGGRLDRYIGPRNEIAGVAAFYKANGYRPLWIGNGAPNQRAGAVMEVLRHADADGLDPNSFHIPDFQATQGSPEKLAQAELKFTNAVLAYARRAQAGRFSAKVISDDIDATQIAPRAGEVLQRLAKASDIAAALTGYNPPQAGYKALRAKLAELRAHPSRSKPIVIPRGPLLRYGVRDARVPLLRKRLGVPAGRDHRLYDAALAKAVQRFQAQAGLRPDGVLGPNALAALNGASHGNAVDTVIANMERWRWLPRDLGRAYVMVNIPDFRLKVVRDGQTVWTTKVVVGKPDTPTPLFSARIENIVLNPTWHVPESIIYNEYLPALQRDPRILDRLGLKLIRGPDGKLAVQQPPGEENALGRMKFNFPNRFQVYLHDTPQKNLFRLNRRAFSHGCMRVEDPAKFGEVLLSLAAPRSHYTAESLTQSWGGPEAWLKFQHKIPVYLVYLTAFVDAGGKLVLRNDIYGIDKKVTAVLKGDTRFLARMEAAKVADVKPEVTDEQRRELERYVNDSPGFDSPGSFLDRIFRQ